MSSHVALEPSKGRFLSCFFLEQTIIHCFRSWPHPLNCVCACVWLFRAATISFAELKVRLLFEGSYYSRCGFCSNKYGRCICLFFFLCMRVRYCSGVMQWLDRHDNCKCTRSCVKLRTSVYHRCLLSQPSFRNPSFTLPCLNDSRYL